VVVVMESSAADAGNYQIQIWHVTVLRTPVTAVEFPRKEI